MLKIDMNNGRRYTFDDYDDYTIRDDFLVIYKNGQWIGYFALRDMVCFFVEQSITDELTGVLGV